jgi:sigma-B regulation protein RsbU (phosphoserine phosphatase)
LNHAGDGFSAVDVDFLAELAAPFAIALTTASLHRDLVAQARMKEELRMAAEIQRTLRPTTEAAVDGLALETLIRPCLEVGGDYFDLIPSPDQARWWLIMADVSGKGVAAGLIAANIQAFMWSRRAGSSPLAAVVAEANDLLYGLARGRKFATMVVVEWFPASRLARWVSAGHLPLLLGRDDQVQSFEATGRPIGLLPNQSYTSEERALAAGDRLLLYTDGILEAGMGSACGEFGLDRINAAFAGPPGARAALDRLAAALAEHLGDEAPDDDVTMLCAECE